ncbi:hypothetical protein [Sphingomonas alpina]|uniref:Uncharacterized protein n=1 Tax=Sphingomonas alpina TaxID=653931 RepID=A0A7H0LP66_9SPHN|nr:hypothetical protein [Sphingomonas alpina]QNQ11469.1 hypothetical protein H3Z74_10225 [Sphingomonas alpina]
MRGIVVDSVDIISDVALTGFGAKAKVDHVTANIPAALSVLDKFVAFVDREWEELIDPNTSDPLPWSFPLQTGIRIKTPGHSIENFGFAREFVEVYLRHFGGSVATPALLADVGAAIPELMRAGAAFSEIARKHSIIGKCANIFELSDIHWNGRSVTLSILLEARLASRGAQNVVGLIAQFTNEYHGKWSQAPLSHETHFHAHGHIGEAILWFGIAEIAVSHGFSAEIGREIASGRREEKRRVWHTWMCSLAPATLAPIDQALT